ncbi:MAG TPA: carboxylate-amine ligase [Solirubrobacterales bacterium]|nr:carboxylate-amine ligase [Solirubrobacterales bacterium]
MIEHAFTGPSFTVGIEEELMLLDPDTLDLAGEIEAILDIVPPEHEGQVKPELLTSVLEIATPPCADINEAGEELRELRQMMVELAAERNLLVGAAGTHPFGRWEDQAIVDRPRYRELVESLGYIARRELIFGTHVHVAIEGADRAIYVADGIRRFLPLLLALSTNSPFWRGHTTGMMSARIPVFRSFPREGIPPHYGTWEIYSHRVGQMIRAGAIEDYTFMWWDVRPHPKLGTVETRICDQQTSLESTLALAALTASLARRLSALYDSEEPLVEYPTELIDDNKVRAAIRGMEGELVDFRAGRPVPAPEIAERLLEELADDAKALGCASHLEAVGEILRNGTGARYQLAAWERRHQLEDVVRGLVLA